MMQCGVNVIVANLRQNGFLIDKFGDYIDW